MKTCAITGAAQGIGRALARQFTREGYKIVGIDFDEKASAKTKAELLHLGGDATFHRADLSSPEDVQQIATKLAEGPQLDVLIHNAGINYTGRFEGSDLSRQRKVISVNLHAPLLLTAQLLAHGKIAPQGTIVFVSSLSRFVSYPGAACYAASKDGLSSYARSLGVALAPKKISVLTVYPGPTRTEHARLHSPDNSKEERRMPPEDLAKRIHEAVKRRKRVLVPGFGNRFFATLGTVLPGVTEWAMKKTILDKLE